MSPTSARAAVLVLLVTAAACSHRAAMPKYSETEYRVGREDVIEVLVYGDGNLSRTLPVRPDGKIALPLCGEMDVAGLSPREIASAIEARMRAWLKDPRVSVFVREVNAARVYVLGEVNRPGALPLRSRMNVLNALASAGGLTEWAHAGRIVVVRRAKAGTQRFKVDLDDAIDGDPDADFELAPGDTVYVP